MFLKCQLLTKIKQISICANPQLPILFQCQHGIMHGTLCTVGWGTPPIFKFTNLFDMNAIFHGRILEKATSLMNIATRIKKMLAGKLRNRETFFLNSGFDI